MSKWYTRAEQVRRLQDEKNDRPPDTPEYAVATLVTTTSVESMIEHQLQLRDAWTQSRDHHEPRNKNVVAIEETDAYVRYAQQMAYRGEEI